MNRRSFLAGLGALIGGIAIEEAIPFGRVWSFPKSIVIAKPANSLLNIEMVTLEALKILARNLQSVTMFIQEQDRDFAVGGTMNIRTPARYSIA